MIKVILTHTNNPAFKSLEGQEGYLRIDEANNFHFTYEQNGQSQDLFSHVDGRLGELGDVYRSPEIAIKTGMCEFSFDQRTPYLEQEKTNEEQEKSTYKIILNKDLTSMYEKATQGDTDTINAYNAIVTQINNGEIQIVEDLPNIKQHLDEGYRRDIEIVGRGIVHFDIMPNSNNELISVAINSIGDSIDAVYGRGDFRGFGRQDFSEVFKEKMGLKDDFRQEQTNPKIMLYEDYNKMRTDFFANRNNPVLAAQFNDVAAKIQNNEILLVPSVKDYVKQHLDAGNRNNIEIVGRGSIGFQEIPCSDLVAISINPVENDFVGVYSRGEVEVDARFGNLEDAIEQNGKNDIANNINVNLEERGDE